MKIVVTSAFAVLVSTVASVASLRYGPIAGLAPIVGYGAVLVWLARRHPEEWDG